MVVTKLLASSSYCIYNKNIGKKLGPIASIMLSVLCDKFKYFKDSNQLTMIEMDFDGVMKEVPCFYYTRPSMTEETGILADQQRAAEKRLIESGIIKKKDCGMPKKNYYYIDEVALMRLLEQC